ncbi:MAG: phytanoyl-CoA dioxygenase family protein [Steroidobacteraceae bacterium]
MTAAGHGDHASPSGPALAPWVAAEDLASFQEQGVVCLRGVFGNEWLEELRAGVEEALRNPGPLAENYTPQGRPGRFFSDLDLWQRLPRFRNFVFRSPAAALAGRLLQSQKVNFLYDQLFVKEPGTAERTPWHQDQPYWAVSGRQVCSLWLPLDPVAAESSVHYIKGSHRWPAYNPRHFSDHSPYRDTGLPDLPDIDAHPDRYERLSWDMQPGDCLMFQAMTVHGASGNASMVHRRRALATRWCGDDARFVRRAGEVAIPTTDPGLAEGAELDCEQFPVVWRAFEEPTRC